MKRVLSLFLSCIFVLGVCFSTPVVASAAEDDLILKLGEATTAYEPYIFKELTAPDLEKAVKGTCALVGYTGNDEVKIESADINSDKGTYILTKIASTAFSNGMSNTTLTIPANITSIEDGAFDGCDGLKYIVYQGTKDEWESKFQNLNLGTLILHTSECTSVTYDDTNTDNVITATCNCGQERGTLTLVSDDTIVYDGNSHKVDVIVSGTITDYNKEDDVVLYKDTANADASATDTAPTNVGSYTATLTIAENVSATKTFDITPATITAVLPEDFTAVYNGSEHKPEVNFTGLVGEETLTASKDYELSYSANTTNAGKAQVVVKLTDNVKNYIFADDEEITLTYTIEKTNLNIKAKAQTIASGANPSFTVEDVIVEGLVDNDRLDSVTITVEDNKLTVSEAVIKNASDVEVTDNYNISYEQGTLTYCSKHTGGVATCQQKAICTECSAEYGGFASHGWGFTPGTENNTIVATCGTDGCTYHENSIVITLTSPTENLVYDATGTSKEAKVTVSAENTGIEPVVEYKSNTDGVELVDGKCVNAGNYTASITLGNETVSVEFTIAKAPAEFDAPTKNTLTYNREAQELVTPGSATGGKFQYKLAESDAWSDEIPTKTDAGEYTVYYQFVADDNHECDENTSNKGSVEVTIKQMEIDVSFSIKDDDVIIYNGKPQQVLIIFTIKNDPSRVLTIDENEDYNVKYYRGEEPKTDFINAGNITAKISLAANSNYTFVNEDGTATSEATLNYTINKATPKAENFIFTAPENLTYDDNEKTATVVVKDGITGMGAITIKYYDANGALLTETPKAEGTYTVKINIEEGTNFNAATEITRDNWKFTINEHEHDWKYSASGAVITATCQNGGCDINETIKLEVNEPENLVYDGGKKEVTYTITKGYEEVFGNKIIVSYAGDKVEQGECINQGVYTAVVKSQAGTAILDFLITPRTIIITDIEGLERDYDGTTKVDLSTATEVKYSNGIDDKPLEFDFSKVTADAKEANVGTKLVTLDDGKVTVKGDENGNYQCVVLDDNRITVEITPATLIITPDAKSSEQYYDLPALTYKVNGLIGKDELTKTPTLTTNADIKTVGNYTITATGAEASTNYKITYAPAATLTVTEHKNHKVATDGWKVTVPGTCMVVGKEAGTCTLCSGTVTRDSKIDPNNHALITTVTKKETCTQNGEALVTCANGCSYSLKTTLPADGELHSFAEDFTVIESTCVAKGVKYKVCQNPGCKVVSEKTEIAINPDAHKNIVTINAKEATCEEKGYTGDEFCNDCKKITDPGIEINAKGHTESDWIVDKEPTFTEEGAKHTACTVCKKELKKEVIAKRALEVPEVKIENASNGIKVSWSQDEDATGYTVYSSTYNATTKKWSAWKNRGTAAATKSSWTDKTVSEGVTYRYTVRSVNGTNKSNYKATSGLCYVVAPKVTVSITSTGLLTKWNKVNNATSYIVYRRALVNGVWSSWVNLGSTKAEKNTWSDTSVQSGVTYRYTVRAVVGKVKSGYTASSSIIYLAQPLLKISNANTGITGKWDPIAGATGYTIYRSEYNPSTKKWSKWLTLGTTGATAKTFTDKTVKSGYEYKYTIRAVNGKFKSTYQDSNKLVYLAQPTLKISNVANGIQGKWSQVNGATGYIIYRRELKDGKWSNWTSLGTTKSTAKTFTDKTVESGVTYKYTIRAKNGSYKSSYVSTGSLVFLSVPTVKISNGITGVNVSWSKIEGATSYLVYRRELIDGKWTKWAEFKTVSETSLVDETVKSGTNYRYTVRALNGKSRSMYTSTGTLYYLTAPTVTVEKVDGVVKVNWTQTVGAKGYTIYRAELGADGKWSKWVTLGTATEKYSSCKDKTAKTGVTYKYTVRAVNGKVKSAYVDGAQITNQ